MVKLLKLWYQTTYKLLICPTQIKVTNQLLLTVATLVLLLYQVTHCSQASDGVMVAINWNVSQAFNSKLLLFKLTQVTGTTYTSILTVSVNHK